MKEGQCYYCSKSIPADALNCPNCGKERKELDSARSQYRFGIIMPLICIFGFIFLRSSDYTFRRGLENGSPDAVGLTAFIFLVALGFALLGGYGRRRYEQISGKKIMGF